MKNSIAILLVSVALASCTKDAYIEPSQAVVCNDADFNSFTLTLTSDINQLSGSITTPECGVIRVDGLVEATLLSDIPNSLDTMSMAVTNPEFLRPCEVEPLVEDLSSMFNINDLEIGRYGYVGFDQGHRIWVLMIQRTDYIAQSNPMQRWALIALSSVLEEWAQ